MNRLSRLCLSTLLLFTLVACATSSDQPNEASVRTWEMQQLVFHAENPYDNPYTEVDVWVQLKGPDFDKRVYGFWDGGNRYVVRLMPCSGLIRSAASGSIGCL